MLLAFLTWIVKCSCWHVFFPLCLISELSEKEGKQLSAVADASTAAARAGCHPAALTQHTRPQRRRYGRQLRVLGPQGGARGEGQCPAETLLCSYGYCWSQVGSGECGISSNVSHSLQSLREAKWTLNRCWKWLPSADLQMRRQSSSFSWWPADPRPLPLASALSPCPSVSCWPFPIWSGTENHDCELLCIHLRHTQQLSSV